VFSCVLDITEELPKVVFEKSDKCMLVGVMAQRGNKEGKKNIFSTEHLSVFGQRQRAGRWDVTIHSLLKQCCYFSICPCQTEKRREEVNAQKER